MNSELLEKLITLNEAAYALGSTPTYDLPEGFEIDCAELSAMCAAIPDGVRAKLPKLSELTELLSGKGVVSEESALIPLIELINDLASELENRVLDYEYRLINEEHTVYSVWITGESEWLATTNHPEISKGLCVYFRASRRATDDPLMSRWMECGS